MEISRLQVLQFIHKEVFVSEYPFVETGTISIVRALADEGLLERIEVEGDLDRYRITEAGRQELSRLRAAGDTAIEE
jgi:DNA-binding PadR family transcriptional regulator